MKNEYIPFDYRRAEEIAKRTKAFYESKSPQTQIHIKSCGSLKLPKMPPLNTFDLKG